MPIYFTTNGYEITQIYVKLQKMRDNIAKKTINCRIFDDQWFFLNYQNISISTVSLSMLSFKGSETPTSVIQLL